jgi:hypothetical protein
MPANWTVEPEDLGRLLLRRASTGDREGGASTACDGAGCPRRTPGRRYRAVAALAKESRYPGACHRPPVRTPRRVATVVGAGEGACTHASVGETGGDTKRGRTTFYGWSVNQRLRSHTGLERRLGARSLRPSLPLSMTLSVPHGPTPTSGAVEVSNLLAWPPQADMVVSLALGH